LKAHFCKKYGFLWLNEQKLTNYGDFLSNFEKRKRCTPLKLSSAAI